MLSLSVILSFLSFPSSPVFETPVNPITIPAQGSVSHDFEQSFKEEVNASNGEKPHLSPDQRQHRGNGSPTLENKQPAKPKDKVESPKEEEKKVEPAKFPIETTTEGITVSDISKKPAKGNPVHINNGPGPSKF